MAVFTPVSDAEARNFLDAYDLGDLVALTPIAEGVENTNYALQAGAGRFVLTLFEGRTDAAALPFCLGLTDRLADAGLPTARPVRDRSGSWLGTLNGRCAAVVEWLNGAWPRTPSPLQAQAAGAMLARMHLAAADHAGRRDNPPLGGPPPPTGRRAGPGRRHRHAGRGPGSGDAGPGRGGSGRAGGSVHG